MNNIDTCPHALSHDCPLRPEKPVFGFDGCAFHNAGYTVILGGLELVLAEVLWKNFGECVTTDRIYHAFYGSLPDADLPEDPDGVIKVKLCHLRKKFRRVGLVIRNLYGVGYILDLAKNGKGPGYA